MSTVRIVTRARAEGLVILLLALGYLWEARNIPSLYASPGVPGPAAFPEVLAAALALAGAWRLLRGAPADEQAADDAKTAEEREESAAKAAAAGGGAKGWIAAHGKFLGLWAVLLGFFVFMPELGFPLGAFLALVGMGWLLGERRWPVIVAGSLVVTVVLYFAFAKGLGVRLPLGALAFLGR